MTNPTVPHLSVRTIEPNANSKALAPVWGSVEHDRVVAVSKFFENLHFLRVIRVGRWMFGRRREAYFSYFGGIVEHNGISRYLPLLYFIMIEAGLSQGNSRVVDRREVFCCTG